MSAELRHQSVQYFLDQLASATPTPGGGSVAALTGALAAGLITMVCDLTIGRPRYADFDAHAQQIRASAEAARAQLTDLIQDDIRAYQGVAAAYKMAKDDAHRPAAIVTASLVATDTPLAIAERAAALLPLCVPLATHGNRSAVGDVAAAAHLAVAAVEAALVNVTANLVTLRDHARYDEFVTRHARAQSNLAAHCAAAVAAATARM
jgi:formiminotetrahydrofolate cyclodeaminase